MLTISAIKPISTGLEAPRTNEGIRTPGRPDALRRSRALSGALGRSRVPGRSLVLAQLFLQERICIDNADTRYELAAYES